MVPILGAGSLCSRDVNEDWESLRGSGRSG